MLGFVSNTNPYLQHCDMFTLTSPIEGFGIVYLEAMQYIYDRADKIIIDSNITKNMLSFFPLNNNILR